MSKSLIYDLMDKLSKLRKVFDSHKSIKPLDHPDKSVTPSKIDYVNEPAEGLVLAYDSATGRFKWIAGAGMIVHDKSYHQSPTLPDNDIHRTSIPIDHPDGAITTTKLADGSVTRSKLSGVFPISTADIADGAVTTAKIADNAVVTSKIADRSVTRAKLEYPTVDVTFAYLASINKVRPFGQHDWDMGGYYTTDVFADRAIEMALSDQGIYSTARSQGDEKNRYSQVLYSPASNADHIVWRYVNGVQTTLGSEAVNIGSGSHHLCKLSISGSTIRAFRLDMNTPKFTATDTTFSSGYWGIVVGWSLRLQPPLTAYLRAPSSPSPQVIAYFEVPVIGSGTLDDPFRPQMPEEIVWDWSLNPVAKRKYDILKSKGFIDEEIVELFPEVLSCRTNRLALTNSALIVSDLATGKPREYTAIVRVFDQPDRQPHLHPISKCIEELRKMKGVKELKRDQAIKRAKQLDDKLHDLDLVSIRELKLDKKKAIKEYKDWRRSQFNVEMEDGIAEMYVEEDKGW